MAPHIKLSYFDVKGLGEPIRMLLSYGNLEFEDDRFSDDQWPQRKSRTPFGQVPLYEEDGKVANQSVSIARYVAKKVKLAGNTDWENLEIDSIVDTITDLRLKIGLYHYEKDPKIKASLKDPLFNETIPFYLERFEKIAKDNKGHLALGRPTWADVYLTGILDNLNFIIGRNLLDGYPNLQTVAKNVLALPAIKKWVETRPVTKS